jgi:hypothetical protein
MKFYGIRHKKTKRPLGFSTSSNDGADLCVNVSFELDGFAGISTSNVWLVTERSNAENVFTNDTPWFNAGYESPKVSDYYIKIFRKEYEVFEVEI